MIRRCVQALVLSPLLAGLSLACSTPALAASAAGPPQWTITSVAGPTYFKPSPNLNLGAEVVEKSKIVKGLLSIAKITAGVGVTGAKVPPGTAVEKVLGPTEVELTNPIEGEGEETVKEPLAFVGAGVYLVTATNVGGEKAEGPIKIKDTLTGEVHASSLAPPRSPEGEYGDAFSGNPLVEGSATPLNCTISPSPHQEVTCEYSGRVAPGDTLTFRINVNFNATAGTLKNEATVSGGGAVPESAKTEAPTTEPTPVTEEPVPFGPVSFLAAASTTAAGAHPNFTTSFALKWGELREDGPFPSSSARQIDVDLPPGLTGDAQAVPRCNIDWVRRELCPEDTAVGIATVRIQGGPRYRDLVYNITPYPDEPAALAFTVGRGIATGRLDTSVRMNSLGEYTVHVTVPDINESAALLTSSVTLWGVPSLYNGKGPDISSECGIGTCRTFGGPGDKAGEEKAFMRNQTSCGGSPEVVLKMKAWQLPEATPAEAKSPLAPATECSLLAPLFTPSLEVTPDKSTEIAPNTFQAGAPAGYEVHVNVPQEKGFTAKSSATPDLRNSTVTLPLGTVASPSAANGLEACSDAQFDRSSLEEAHCPLRSEIGKLEIQTPLLLAPLTGQVFLGQPECSPCGPSEAAEGKVTRLFLQAQGSGVRVKLEGRTDINQENGQLTTIFNENPQQPFERLTLRLDSGPGAALSNPRACEAATTTSELVPWSSTSAAPLTEAERPSSTFQVGGCTSRFAPSFNAGMTETLQAGAFSAFTTTFSRTDQDQTLGGITVQMPQGLLGSLKHVTQCGEPQAAEGKCGPESQIGTVTVGAGPGPHPFWIETGRAYLTGAYKDAPFGLSIVVPAVAGPFNLGEEHTRARVFVDPHTSAISVVSDPLPIARDGIPFQVRTIEVKVNRHEFTFNATNCNALAINATISSTPQGTVATASAPYKATGCASLPFSPELTAEAGGHGSKANGTSFTVRVKAAPGQANIAKTFLQLPLQLPSRLSTIQKACLAATFEANPASCDEGSVIGTAIAHTPLLNSPLTGPAYLVSHGNAAFPDVEFVLQGERITLILDGKTDIKNGITYSRFETVPDAPVETFETVLPTGPHSALTTNVPESENYSLCNQTLEMPTEITGQNGAVVKQNTIVAKSGCPASNPTVSARVGATRSGVTVTATTGMAGTVWVSGFGLVTTHSYLAAGTHQIRASYTRLGMRRHRHHARMSVRVKLIAGGRSVTKATTVRT